MSQMSYRKIIIRGIMLLSTLLLVSMTLRNADVTTLESEDDDSDGSLQTKPVFIENLPYSSEIIVVRGDDGNMNFIIPGHLKDQFIDDISNLTEGQGERDFNDGDVKLSQEGDTKSSFIDEENSKHIKSFSSFEEFKRYLENHTDIVYYPGWNPGLRPITFELDTVNSAGEEVTLLNSNSMDQPDHSTTNNQIDGVDEGDIVKNDGQFVYIISRDKQQVIIAHAYPPERASVLSTIRSKGSIKEIYVNGDVLVVIGSRLITQLDPQPLAINYKIYSDSLNAETSDFDTVTMNIGNYYFFRYTTYLATSVEIFDIKDREIPTLVRTHLWKGSSTQSRMIEDRIYVITQQYISYNINKWELPVPVSQIYYFNDTNATELCSSHHLTTITSINITDTTEEPNSKAILMDSSNNIFVSLNNIYITRTRYVGYLQKTIIHRISIENGEIHYVAKGNVSGYVLNRFSMDEYDGYLRIATTTRSPISNSVYVLDMNLNVVGSLEDIALGERMYSARFMGTRGYLVTFRRIDPFWVVNLTDPTAPQILGELQIPGWSDYLHPYDDNHVIGVGRETNEFGWLEGVKLSLFNVTDVQNPKETSKIVIGDSRTYTLASSDPHAFLFSREKNLIVIPIRLNNSMGYDAYVFDLTLEHGFILKEVVSHADCLEEEQPYYWYRYFSTAIKRSFYIKNILYTLSDKYLKMNDLYDLREIRDLVLPNESDKNIEPPTICIYVEPLSV